MALLAGYVPSFALIFESSQAILFLSDKNLAAFKYLPKSFWSWQWLNQALSDNLEQSWAAKRVSEGEEGTEARHTIGLDLQTSAVRAEGHTKVLNKKKKGVDCSGWNFLLLLGVEQLFLAVWQVLHTDHWGSRKGHSEVSWGWLNQRVKTFLSIWKNHRLWEEVVLYAGCSYWNFKAY